MASDDDDKEDDTDDGKDDDVSDCDVCLCVEKFGEMRAAIHKIRIYFPRCIHVVSLKYALFYIQN